MITLIMPAYNEEKDIANSIRSIQNQTVSSFELIIVNDGSSDKTAEIIEETIKGDSRIKFINPQSKVGKNGAINLAFKEMTGSWLYFMGADDILPNDALEKWEKAISGLDSSKCIALRARMRVFSKSPKYNGLVLPKNKKRENFSGPIMLQSSGLLKYSLPLPEQFPNEDTWWGLCVQTFAQKICIDDIVVNYNVHEGNSISRKDNYSTFTKKYHDRYIARVEFLKKYKKEMNNKRVNEMEKELYFEDLRWKGKTLKLFFIVKGSIINKLRWVCFSNKILYSIKMRFDRFLLGH